MKTSLNSALAFAMAVGTASFSAHANIPPQLPILEKIEGTNNARCIAVLLIDAQLEGASNPNRAFATSHYRAKTRALLKDQTTSIFTQIAREEMAPFTKKGGFTQNDAIIWVKKVNDCIEGASTISSLYP